MFETPSSYSFLSTTSVSAGQTITFTDASGNVLATFTLPNGSAEMVMCSQESSVTCYTGGTLSVRLILPARTARIAAAMAERSAAVRPYLLVPAATATREAAEITARSEHRQSDALA